MSYRSTMVEFLIVCVCVCVCVCMQPVSACARTDLATGWVQGGRGRGRKTSTDGKVTPSITWMKDPQSDFAI